MVVGDNAFLAELEAVRTKLAERGASGSVQDYTVDLLVAAHQKLHAGMAAEAEKRAMLVDVVRQLEVRGQEVCGQEVCGHVCARLLAREITSRLC